MKETIKQTKSTYREKHGNTQFRVLDRRGRNQGRVKEGKDEEWGGARYALRFLPLRTEGEMVDMVSIRGVLKERIQGVLLDDLDLRNVGGSKAEM